jgi:dihydrolipoamide dehydrogenase
MSSSSSADLVVIGGGPGGYAAAFYAADVGLNVTLVDREPNPGGVCLYRGCIPSKALLHVAKVASEARHASNWGLTYTEPEIDLDKLRGFKDGVVSKLTGGLGQLSKQRKVTYVQGSASFVDARTVSIEPAGGGDATRVAFEHAIIATGSQPARIPGLSIDSPRVMD